jgi:hypothetical protein
MQLDYTYTSRGPSAATLTANATASGRLVPPKGSPSSVTISSSYAKMTSAGKRKQVGDLVTRTGSTATGTFTGTVGGEPWSGLITMTKGIQTLDLGTNAGTHTFSISFTASR